MTGHPVPIDTRGWSQILVSSLCGIKGLERKKGPDLIDGSDVKAANAWESIDNPRFNGVIKSGTQSDISGKIDSLDSVPNLFFVLWDETLLGDSRCRIWIVRPQQDILFRSLCEKWYNEHSCGQIVSDNFQLHPPCGKEGNVLTNNCGTLSYPLYFHAEKSSNKPYIIKSFNPEVRLMGICTGYLPQTLEKFFT